MPEPLIIVHERVGNAVYQEDTVISSPIAMFGADGELPILQGFNNNPAITVAAAGRLFSRGLQVSGSTTEGVRVNGGQAWISGARVINNTGGGIVVSGNGMLVLENSFVGGSSNNPSLDIVDGTAEVVFATLALGTIIPDIPSLSCTDGTGSIVRNSLILSNLAVAEVDCPNITIGDSALEMSMGDNVTLGDMQLGWFANYANGDFHLSAMHPAAIDTAAVWMTGDPTVDIDGDPRVNMDGMTDVAGADVP